MPYAAVPGSLNGGGAGDVGAAVDWLESGGF